MKSLLINGELTEEMVKEIEELTSDKNIETKILTTDKEMEEEFYNQYKKMAGKNRREELIEIIEKFLEQYAIEFKKNKVPLPKYISITTNQEYNDETYDETISDIYFYDENKKIYNVDFEIEYNGYEEDFEYAFSQEIEYESGFDINDIKKYMNGSYLKISLGE